MDLLSIKHLDFELTIECSKFDAVWSKAKLNIGLENLTSTYKWTEGVLSVKRFSCDDEPINVEYGSSAQAVFFDNVDYPIWVEFNEKVSCASFGSALQNDNDSFSFHKGRHILSGFINYGNDIGQSEIKIFYTLNGIQKKFIFSFEVLSSKLNYHEHWRCIINDIESEYSMLSLDYMRRTFHGFSPSAEGERPELIWWSVFSAEQMKFIKAVRFIIDQPRHRLHNIVNYKRADKLKRIPQQIENDLAEHRNEEAHLYRITESLPSNDTAENRFLKYALGYILNKYERLKKQIETHKNVSTAFQGEMNAVFYTLKKLQNHPFFRTIGNFKGLNQESLVLQKATGYSQVYRTWNLLRKAYSLNEGMYRLQTKDIATLYEIWCFIEVSHIVKKILDESDSSLEIDHENRMEMNGHFTWEMGKGEHSSIIFRQNNVELAELIYNPKQSDSDNNISIKNLFVPTVPQKPDIVLRLCKNDLSQHLKMTYLFDAKYRIDHRDNNNVDLPPEDAINQMHRYRDAIYYKDYDSDSDALKKEVIGGYILFPGDGNTEDVMISKFYQTINQVNIGAFPLKPMNNHNMQLLEDFIRSLLDNSSKEIISKVIPQKGTIITVADRVLVGVVKPSPRKGYYESFENSTANFYYTGKRFPTSISLYDLRYFIPYFKEKGIRDVYEVTKIRTISTAQAKQLDTSTQEADEIRLAFDLRFSHKMFDDFQKIKTNDMINYTFIDTTFDQLNKRTIDND